jgi:hypothetical protein
MQDKTVEQLSPQEIAVAMRAVRRVIGRQDTDQLTQSQRDRLKQALATVGLPT